MKKRRKKLHCRIFYFYRAIFWEKTRESNSSFISRWKWRLTQFYRFIPFYVKICNGYKNWFDHQSSNLATTKYQITVFIFPEQKTPRGKIKIALRCVDNNTRNYPFFPSLYRVSCCTRPETYESEAYSQTILHRLKKVN